MTRPGDIVFAAREGGPRESGCPSGESYGRHQLSTRAELYREITTCTRCAAEWARPSRQVDRASGLLRETPSRPWTVLRPPRRPSAGETRARTAAIVRSARQLGATIVDDEPSGRDSKSADPAEEPAPPVSFGAWRRPPLNEEQVGHALWAQRVREEERREELLRLEERRRQRRGGA